MRQPGIADAEANVIAETPAGVVMGLTWRVTERREQMELFQVLRLRSGKIVDMQDHRSRGAALRSVGVPGR